VDKESRSGGPALTASPLAKRSDKNASDSGRSLCVFRAGALRQPHFCVWRCFTIGKFDHQLNEDIRDKEIRVIGPDGAQLGIMSSRDALNMAYEKEMDLVKIAPGSNPPVCKIMDYGKFRFEQMKKEKEAKKNQHVVEIKEVRMSPGIDTNDFNVKLKNAQKFLKEGNRVKVTVRFRGREMAHTNIGEQLLAQFSEACADVASVEKNPKLDGRHMTMFLSPKTK
jgi:translation initiation factor IF-3